MTTPTEFLTAVVPSAQSVCRQTGIPASVMLAQAIDESGWGRSQLATAGKNLFGIKADASWTGSVMALPTIEYVDGKAVRVMAKWRVYKAWDGSILDHAKYFFDNERYKPALEVVEQPLQFAAEIQKCGYATDPQYAEKLGAIIRGRSLQQYDIPKSEWNLVEWAVYPS